MSTEADTCRKFVVPALQKAGWDDPLHSIAEQRPFILKVEPFKEFGNVSEIAGRFRGSDKLKKAVEQLQALLYAS